jgi:hypothetical protein
MKTHTQDLGQKKHTFKCFAHKSFILVLGYLQVMLQWPIGCVALKLCETMVFGGFQDQQNGSIHGFVLLWKF